MAKKYKKQWLRSKPAKGPDESILFEKKQTPDLSFAAVSKTQNYLIYNDKKQEIQEILTFEKARTSEYVSLFFFD